MTGGDAMRQLFRKVGEFARATRDADRQRPASERYLKDRHETFVFPPSDKQSNVTLSDAPRTYDGSTGTFDGIVGEKQREAIVVQRLKEFGRVAGLEWDDQLGVDANLTTWFLNQSDGR